MKPARALAVFAALSCAGAAWAQEIDGEWRFKTGKMSSQCVITGDIVFHKSKAKGELYTCEFTSRADCVV